MGPKHILCYVLLYIIGVNSVEMDLEKLTSELKNLSQSSDYSTQGVSSVEIDLEKVTSELKNPRKSSDYSTQGVNSVKMDLKKLTSELKTLSQSSNYSTQGVSSVEMDLEKVTSELKNPRKSSDYSTQEVSSVEMDRGKWTSELKNLSQSSDYSFQGKVCASSDASGSCCNLGHPGDGKCGEGEGDCDDDTQCLRGLKCGKDNCPNENGMPSSFDCCYRPTPAVGWASWGSCSKPCKGGIQRRTCTNRHGHRRCVGRKSRRCNSFIECAVDGGWSSWGSCSKCTGGVQKRTCTNPPPSHHGEGCYGKKSKKCNRNIPCLASHCAEGRGDSSDSTDYCYDIEGNSYNSGEALLSCHGCFKYICNINEDAESASWPLRKTKWDKIPEHTCCHDCEGNGFPLNSTMKVENVNDRCSTTTTTKCVFSSKEKKAVIEKTFSYRTCCTNSSGIYPLETYKLIPETCSMEKCLRSDGSHEASWIITQIKKGCNCCVYREKLIPDGEWVTLSNGQNSTCYEGRLLVSPDDEVTFPAQKCFHEDTQMTFHDLGKNHMGQDTKPEWVIDQGGRRIIEQKRNTRPSVGITNLGDSSRPVSFTGRVYSKDSDNDVIGMVFGYHNEANFFVVASSAGGHKGTINWYVGRLHATCGSSCSTKTTISDAIWNPSKYTSEITVLAKGNNYWKHPNKYRFSICFNPAKLLIDVTITNESNGQKDLKTGTIHGVTKLTHSKELSRLGGHVGVYVDSQARTVWDELDCTDCKLT